jgi:CheY-like chemotaxis protein
MTHEGKVSLLIAEDDPHIRYLMVAAAERTGCFAPIGSFADGESAWEAMRSSAPHDLPEFVVSDLSMPRMSGLDLIRAMKREERTRGIPIAIVTSSDQPSDRDDALTAGAAAFEQKPQGLEALTQLLATLRHSCCDAVVAH